MYIYPRVCYKGGDCRITRVSNQKLFGNIYTFKGVSQRFKQRFLIQTIPASSEYILVRAYFLVEYTMNLKSSVRALVCHILTYISINTNALMHDMFLKFYIYIYTCYILGLAAHSWPPQNSGNLDNNLSMFLK